MRREESVRRFVRDESGMTMGLVVIMIVLIGVMGAGLLTFVMRDLDAVVEVNKGQRAFELADAGAQLGKRQIRLDPQPTHYDLDGVVAAVASPLCDISGTQAVLNGLNLEDLSLFPLLGGNWAPSPTDLTQGGITKSDLDGDGNPNDSVRVTIQWLNPAADPNSASEKVCAAPNSSPADGTSYFRVVSTGEYNGSKRKVEAIYEVYDLGLPKGYFAKQDVTITGTADIANVSVFSLGNINVQNGARIIGTDSAYKSWAQTSGSLTSYPNSYNLKPRGLAVLGVTVPNASAGFGAKGTVTGGTAGRDYGGLVHPQPSTPSSTQMTFPFNPAAEPDLDVLKEMAIEQQNETGQTHYYASNGGTVGIGSPGTFQWPANSTQQTVVFVEYTQDANNKVSWQEDGSCTINSITGLITGDTKKGTLVVKGGDFTMQGNDAPLEGVVIVRGGAFEDGDSTEAGNACLKGYANTSGSLSLRGNASPTNLLDSSRRPGFYGVRLWSWRELYQ